MVEKLNFIADKENFPVSKEVLETISKLSKGDARKAIMTLQNLNYVYDYKKKVDIDDVLSITGHVPKSEILPVLKMSLDINSNVENILNIVNKFKRNGFPIISVLDFVRKYISETADIKDNFKSLIVIQVGMAEKRLMDGSDEFLQLLNLFTYINGVVKNKINYIPSCLC
jgi:replication factor C subunit 2/4